MTRDDGRFTRRRILGGAGTLSALGAAGVATSALSEPAVAYPERVRVEGTQGPGLRLDWRETYNGQLLEDEVDGTATGPIVTLENVLPGDRGVVGFRVQLDETETEPPPTRVRVSLTTTDDPENGIVEPEAKAGDTTTGEGELPELADALVWYDVGTGGFLEDGGCNASYENGEPTIASGSLAAVADALSDGIPLDPTPGVDDDGCFGPDDSVCLGIRWSIPNSVGNKCQTDSVSFDLGFETEVCP